MYLRFHISSSAVTTDAEVTKISSPVFNVRGSLIPSNVGVRASMVNRDHGSPLENYLTQIRDVYRLHKDDLDSIKDPSVREKRLIELNVIEQCLNVYKSSIVQKKRIQTFEDTGTYDFAMPRFFQLFAFASHVHHSL